AGAYSLSLSLPSFSFLFLFFFVPFFPFSFSFLFLSPLSSLRALLGSSPPRAPATLPGLPLLRTPTWPTHSTAPGTPRPPSAHARAATRAHPHPLAARTPRTAMPRAPHGHATRRAAHRWCPARPCSAHTRPRALAAPPVAGRATQAARSDTQRPGGPSTCLQCPARCSPLPVA